jgi:hypothetical protein
MPNEKPVNWEAILNFMRSLWISGLETSLETAFYTCAGAQCQCEPFEDIPRFSLPKWMQK